LYHTAMSGHHSFLCCLPQTGFYLILLMQFESNFTWLIGTSSVCAYLKVFFSWMMFDCVMAFEYKKAFGLFMFFGWSIQSIYTNVHFQQTVQSPLNNSIDVIKVGRCLVTLGEKIKWKKKIWHPFKNYWPFNFIFNFLPW
jgi:hypothetical protein